MSKIGRSLSILAAATLTTLVSLAACPRPAPPKVFKVAILSPGPWTEETVRGLKQRLGELGYREGQTINYVYKEAGLEADRLTKGALELVSQKPDVLYSISTVASLEAIKVSGAVPVVFVRVTDPVEAGVVRALVSPENKATGVALKLPVSKQLEFLQRMAPGIRAVLLPYTPHPTSARVLPELRDAAAKLHLKLVEKAVEDRPGLQAALDTLSPERVQAIFTMPNPLTSGNLDSLAAAALKHRLPLVAPLDSDVKRAGVLFSYSVDTVEVGRQSAELVDKVLRGSPVGALPVELPRRYLLVINMATARAIGLSPPQDLLSLADRLITE